jgi:hypothetical protein
MRSSAGLPVSFHPSMRATPPMRLVRLAALFVVLSTIFASAGARADAVTDWNAVAWEVMAKSNVGGAPATRAQAIMHVAMADAANAVSGRYQRFSHRGAMQPSASAEAAVSSAARNVLLAMFPAQKARVDEAHAKIAGAVPEGAAKAAGEALGAETAAASLAARADDNAMLPDTYRPVTTAGVWIPTAPPITAEYARVRPWSFDNPSQFRPGPPPALASVQYARDYNETKALGGVKSTQRSAEQTAIVRFWTQPNLGVNWFQAARQLATAHKLDLTDCARMFALLSMGQANTFIVDWDAKFHYNFWRPVTAIRNGDLDGNDATERDPGWVPANATPMHPEYPSQAAILAGLSEGILASALNEASAGPVTITDTVDPKLTRTFQTIGAMAEETRIVRIWGGIHFRTSLETSDRMGRALVAHLLANAYRPAR